MESPKGSSAIPQTNPNLIKAANNTTNPIQSRSAITTTVSSFLKRDVYDC